MNLIRDPESMTVDERRDEVAGILAAGLLRCVCQAKSAQSADQISSPNSRKALDLSSKTRLTVSQRSAG